jgi:hypothetical protein
MSLKTLLIHSIFADLERPRLPLHPSLLPYVIRFGGHELCRCNKSVALENNLPRTR